MLPLEQEREQEQELMQPLELVLVLEPELVPEELMHKTSQLSLGPFEEKLTKRERYDE